MSALVMGVGWDMNIYVILDPGYTLPGCLPNIYCLCPAEQHCAIY